MSAFINNLGTALLTVVLSFVVLILVVHPPPHEPSVSNIEVLDSNRHLSFEVAGDATQPNAIIWLHGLLSSRHEILAIDEGILKELHAFVVSFDRPGYGESSLHAGRDFATAAHDIAAVADSFGAEKFFVAGASAGGAYALAAASIMPARIRGVLLLSAAGPPEILESEAAIREAERLQGSREGAFLRVSSWPLATPTFRWLVETYVGGRALFSLWLEDVGQKILGRMQDVDARCIMKKKRTEYTLKILPESVKQGVATPVLQDLLLVRRPWPFNISSQIPEYLARATHIWHGSDDKIVPVDYAKAINRQLPHSSLQIVDDGGHHAYWVCDKDRQRLAVSRLIKLGLPA